MQVRKIVTFAVAIALAVSSSAYGAKKKKKKDEELVTQTLPVLKDPPLAVTADTANLVFRVAPLSGKGLLSAQVRDALKVLMQANRNIVKLRAFVAGTGDMRRVPAIVSEMFTDKKLPLPAVTTLQAGALPLEGAQLALEAVAVEKKATNPNGLAMLEVAPVAALERSLATLGVGGNRVLRATCYMPSIDGHAEARAAVAKAFPQAAVNLVQMQRLPVRGEMMCEAVAALEQRPAQEVTIGGGAAMVSAPRLVLTGTQLAFQSKDADIKLAFERLGRTLDSMNSSYAKVVYANVYPLAEDIAAKVRAQQGAFLTGGKPPVVSYIPMEGLPSLDASFAVEAVAVP